jgi:heptosyltransferase-2
VSRGLERRIKAYLARLGARLLRRAPLTAEELRALPARRILVVRQHNQMGDMVCATPAFRALREAYPAAELVLVAAPINDAVVRHNPHLDGILSFDKAVWRNPRRLVRFWRDLRGFRADLAFVLNSVSFSVTSAVLALLSGAPRVVGGNSHPFGWEISDAYSLVLPAAPDLEGHAVDDNLAPLASVGITTDDRSTVVVPAPEQEAEARDLLAGWGWSPGFWMVHPGAGKRQNVWPAERFATVVERATAAGRRLLVIHGPADEPVVRRLREQLGPAARAAVRIAPPLSVGTVAALLRRADRFLCNDTGIMHVAGALRVPTLALFGPTHPEQWKPPVPEVVALASPRRSEDARGSEFGWMENLGTDAVWEAWTALPGRGASVAESGPAAG